jgi:hypothetical protein
MKDPHGRSRRRVKRYRPLERAEHQYIAQYVRSLLAVARDPAHPMSRLAQWQIALAMWRWTADGVDIPSGRVVKDALKYSTVVHPSTQAARAQISTRGLRHEHVVPRVVLARRIIDQDLDHNGIVELLTRFCRAAILTSEEDRRLLPKKEMPPGWTWEDDPFARYVYSKISIGTCPEPQEPAG